MIAGILERTKIKDLLKKQLTSETIIVDLAESIKADMSLSIIDSELKNLDDQTLEICLPKSKTLNSVFAELSQQNLQVHSMRNKTNRLEELFLKKIGGNNV